MAHPPTEAIAKALLVHKTEFMEHHGALDWDKAATVALEALAADEEAVGWMVDAVMAMGEGHHQFTRVHARMVLDRAFRALSPPVTSPSS